MPQRLVEAGLALLAEQGGGGVTVRSVEGRAGVPHGSVRHHFGGLDGLRQGLVAGLLEAERPRASEDSVAAVVQRWLGPDAAVARARYELMLMASRDPGLRETFLAGRDSFIERLIAFGVANGRARALVAMLDGLVLDGILRGQTDVDLELWQGAFAAATTHKL